MPPNHATPLSSAAREAAETPRQHGRIALTVSLGAADAAAIESVRAADGLASTSAAVRRLIRDGLMYRRIREQITEQETTTSELLYHRIRDQIAEHEEAPSR